jgi:hypothetical protein
MQIARGMAAFVSAMALSLSSFAATVVPEDGIVLVNRGSGYVNANGPTIIIVNPGGTARLTYPDGSTVPVAVGAIVTVEAQSPCVTTQGSMTVAQATGGPQDGAPGADTEGPPPDGTGLAETITAVTVGGGVVGAILTTQSNKDRPASP